MICFDVLLILLQVFYKSFNKLPIKSVVCSAKCCTSIKLIEIKYKVLSLHLQSMVHSTTVRSFMIQDTCTVLCNNLSTVHP